VFKLRSSVGVAATLTILRACQSNAQRLQQVVREAEGRWDCLILDARAGVSQDLMMRHGPTIVGGAFTT
jgi:MinD-like ATPase involved in chromosome partitioning or flagellar assembly